MLSRSFVRFIPPRPQVKHNPNIQKDGEHKCSFILLTAYALSNHFKQYYSVASIYQKYLGVVEAARSSRVTQTKNP